MRRLLVAILVLHANLAAAQVGRLLPVDEAVRDPELFAFRGQLQAAIARHDAEADLAAVDPNIKNTFGSPRGWTWVKLRDGRTGYISAPYAWSPVDYRAFFEQTDGRWRLAAFVTGD